MYCNVAAACWLAVTVACGGSSDSEPAATVRLAAERVTQLRGCDALDEMTFRCDGGVDGGPAACRSFDADTAATRWARDCGAGLVADSTSDRARRRTTRAKAKARTYCCAGQTRSCTDTNNGSRYGQGCGCFEDASCPGV
jgi:hypothetical protein